MISLAAVEALAGELWKGSLSAVATVPDARKGERLILVTEAPATPPAPNSSPSPRPTAPWT